MVKMMKVHEVLAADKLILVKFVAIKKKKNNPIKSKTTKIGSFIDVFGGMAGYPSRGSDRKGPTTSS